MNQADQATLLVELLTEELPPKALARLSDAFAQGLVERLAARDLIAGRSRISNAPPTVKPRRSSCAMRRPAQRSPTACKARLTKRWRWASCRSRKS
jgi:glycyl-tRNA synthetase beta chain